MNQVLRKVTNDGSMQEDGIASPPRITRAPKVLDASLRALLSVLPDPAILVDSTGRLAEVNAGAEQIFGYECRELRGQRIDILIPERFRGVHSEHCADYFAQPRPRAMGVGLTLRALRKDGTEFPVEISLGPVETEKGTLVLGAIRDLSASEERYRAIFEQVSVGVAHTTLDGQTLDANPRLCEILGYTRKEALALNIRDVTHPDDIGRSIDARAHILASDRAGHEREVRLIRKNGAEIWTHIGTSLIRSADGRPVHFISMIHDISEHKRAESALLESEERFRAMIEQSISGTCVTDAQHRFVYLNPHLVAILGHESPASLVGRSVLDFVAPEDHAMVAEALRRRIEGGTDGARYSFQAIRKDGSRAVLEAQGTSGSYGGKRVVIATVQDVTALSRAEDELQRTVAKLRRAIHSAVEVVSTIGEVRDPYTHGHERRVGQVATAIAEEMGLPTDCIEGVRVAGYLHDVGKIGVPTQILSKPTRLSKTEFEIVKEHAQKSYEILKGMEFPWPIAEAAWQHHERLDGSGYPRGLKGEEIILEARILAVADTVEAMASHRPYRPGHGVDAALAEIAGNRGILFDAAVVDACLRLFRVKGYRLPA